jgi:hypothetical protein
MSRFPQAVADACYVFLDLSAARGGTGYGPLPVTFPEIEAWARLHGGLDAWEIRLIRDLDAVWMADAHARAERAHEEAMGQRRGAPPAPEKLPEFTLEALMAMAGAKK